MTTNPQLNNEPDFEIDLDKVFEKKNQSTQELLEDENYIVKQIDGSSFKDAYDKNIDFSTEEGKKTFDVLKPMVALQNLVFIPASAYNKFSDGAIDKHQLNEIIENTHVKLSLNKPIFKEEVKKIESNDFLSSPDEIAANEAGTKVINKATPTDNIPSGLKNKDAVTSKPSDILTGFHTQVTHQINALENYKAKVESTRGKISLKTIVAAGGLFALGTFFNPIGALAIPAAILIGGYAVTKSLFARNPEIKNYDKQIDLLK